MIFFHNVDVNSNIIEEKAGMKMAEDRARQIRLNEYQRAAVLDESPACVVNANVGSGKTTVLIEKILYLHLERQVPLEQMVVLTFTNKAADEITERLLRREPDITTEQVEGFGTFHSVALRLLKNRLPVEAAGWTKEFMVMDPDEEADLAAEIIAEQGLKVKYKNRLKKRLEQEYPSYLSGKTESRYKDDLFCLYPLLQEEKKRQNKMSFSDLLRISTQLLVQRKMAAGSVEAGRQAEKGAADRKAGEIWRPAWIIVDEVQDSDMLQLDFLAALRDCGREEAPAKIFAVGDPNQVIYSWRGTGENMFFLLKHRFGAKELTLPVNYRSNASILEAANRFLQFGSGIQGSRTEVSRIAVKNHYDPFQEAEYLAERISAIHEEGMPYGEIAVFYRLQRQSEILTKVFERQGIPYELSVKKTIKDIPVLNWIVKVLRFSVNTSDAQMAVQVLTDRQYGESCTKKNAKRIIMEESGGSGCAAGGAEMLYRRMKGFAENIDSASAEELFQYFGLREALHPASSGYAEDERLAMDFLEKMCAACSRKGISAPEKGSFAEAVREFVNSSALYGMQADAGEKAAGENGGERAAADSVRLMTLHASKGLEFDTVFIIGVNQGLLPLQCRSFEQEEEERRLFFVGITRARNCLELSWYTNPGEPGVSGEPSRYLRMLPDQLLERGDVKSEEERWSGLQQMRRQVREQIRSKRARGYEETLPALPEPEAEEQAQDEPGEQAGDGHGSSGEKAEPIPVRHRKYGEGILIAEDEMTVTAEFPGYGQKQFLKAFGELQFPSGHDSA